MLNKLKALFAPDDPQAEPLSPTLAGAALMFEVAWADHDVGDQEIEHIAALVGEIFELEQAAVAEILKETRDLHDESVGVYAFTRAINEALDPEQKYQIVRALWQIAFADATLDRFEEHMIRRIAELLYVPHTRFIEAKLAAKRGAAD